MSRFDYEQSKEIAKLDPTFAALIMAAYRKADSTNRVSLRISFPEITMEMESRYNLAGGLLPGEKAMLVEPEDYSFDSVVGLPWPEGTEFSVVGYDTVTYSMDDIAEGWFGLRDKRFKVAKP